MNHVDAEGMAQRLMGYPQNGSQPAAAEFSAGADYPPEDAGPARPAARRPPYPFFLAHAFNQPWARIFDEVAKILLLTGWWSGNGDGIARNWSSAAVSLWIWSRGEKLVSEQFPELAQAGLSLPDGTVLDGEIVVWRDGGRQPFNEWQNRLGRRGHGSGTIREQRVVLLT